MDFFAEWLGELGIKAEVTVRESNRLTNNILDGEYDIFHWGWYVEPDPTSILDVFTCGQRGNCRRLVVLQPGVRRADDRAEQRDGPRRSGSSRSSEMQKILFEDSPYLVLAYTSDGQAYRSDRFACFVPQPKPDGVLVMQYGAANYTLMRPHRGRR